MRSSAPAATLESLEVMRLEPTWRRRCSQAGYVSGAPAARFDKRRDPRPAGPATRRQSVLHHRDAASRARKALCRSIPISPASAIRRRVMGGRLNRYFSSVLEHIAPEPETRGCRGSSALRSAARRQSHASFESWRKRLKLDSAEVEADCCERCTFRSWSTGTAKRSTSKAAPMLWRDYLEEPFPSGRVARAARAGRRRRDGRRAQARAANDCAPLSARRQSAAARAARQVQFATACPRVCSTSPSLPTLQGRAARGDRCRP